MDVLDAAAMENANNICHGVQVGGRDRARGQGKLAHGWTLASLLFSFLSQDLLYFRGFYWDGQNKKGKGKTRKKKGKGK